MANLTVQDVNRSTGLAVSKVAAAGGGDTFDNNGRTFLVVNNGGASPITVTVDSVTPCSYGADHNEPSAASVAAAGERLFGPFPPDRFGASTSVSYSGVTSVTVAAVRLPAA